jgi:16S rRNA processing protein RimM
MTTDQDDLIEVGTVIEAYGVRGALKIRPFSDDPVALLAAKEVWLKKDRFPEKKQDFEVFRAKEHSGTVILELVGLTDRDLALSYKSAVVAVSRSRFPALADNEYYWTDLIGAQVHNLQAIYLGAIVEMLDNGAQSVMVVQSDQQKYLIPFVEAFVIQVSLQKEPKMITVDWQIDW